MRNDWLAAAQFERTQAVLSAINTLSIDAKLNLARVENPVPEIEIEQARDRLLAFVTNLSELVSTANESSYGTIVGADPQMSQIARHLISAPAGTNYPQGTTAIVAELPNLLRSTQPADQRKIISYLERLRSVMEQQAASTTPGEFGLA